MNRALQNIIAVNPFWHFYVNVELWQNCNHTMKERLVISDQRSKVSSEGTHHIQPR